ncbi:MAG TPA: D-alanyl-D-alanine carboxypeptidase family protein [Pyrinomonadaceae bacterium]|nr:D-alanyl-D-alanine carboxypeptidase family protein [Pyrinomonadaceae bacterium]
MNTFKHKLIVALFAAAALVAVTDLAVHARQDASAPQATVGAQSPTTHVKPTAKVADGARAEGVAPAVAPSSAAAAAPSSAALTATAPAPIFVSAAARNLSLSEGLQWTFGGKSQRGWSLYLPLVRRLLATDADAASPEFAESLARWQRASGLAPSGVLDDATLYAMISHWQSVRIKDRAHPSPEQLVVAPTSDFYDPTRPDELRQVERRAYDAYKRMVAAAAADKTLGLQLTKTGELAPEEKFLKIVSSFRSRAYQEHLRRQSPNAGRAGLAVNSPHFTGRALDIYVGGDPVETKDANRRIQVDTRVYLWLVRNAESFGFRPYYYEPWHWEYVGEVTTGKR